MRLSQFEETAAATLQPYRALGEFAKSMDNPEFFERVEQANEQVMRGLEQLFMVE